MAATSSECTVIPLKKFKKIPIHVVEDHNDVLQYVYSAIGGKKLPLEGNTLLHLDAHPDMLIDRELKGADARNGRSVLPFLQIENWIVPAAAAGHIGRVVWLRPPWAKQFADGTRIIHVGDHPQSGFLRVDSEEPYYFSDALYSATESLRNKKKFIFTVGELADGMTPDNLQQLVKTIDISGAYILDIDLDFFSTANPFLSLYENINLYDRLESIFAFKCPSGDGNGKIEDLVELRERQLQDIENLFQHLEKWGNLTKFNGEKSELFDMISNLSEDIIREANRLGEPPDWWAVYAAGCTRDQGGLPHHISTINEVRNTVENVLKPLLQFLPPPTMITVARSSNDNYCPPEQVEYIQAIVLNTLKELYDTDDPVLHYMNDSV